MSKSSEKQLKTLLKPKASASLSAREKAKMRLQLSSFIEANPVQVGHFSFLSGLSARLFRLKPLFASLTVVFLFSGISVASAQTALPGDALYDLKIFVNEELPMVFMSQEEREEFAVEQFENRLEEAEALKEKGALDEERGAVLQIRMDEYFDTMTESERAAAIHEQLSTVLDEHEKVLPDLKFSQKFSDWKMKNKSKIRKDLLNDSVDEESDEVNETDETSEDASLVEKPPFPYPVKTDLEVDLEEETVEESEQLETEVEIETEVETEIEAEAEVETEIETEGEVEVDLETEVDLENEEETGWFSDLLRSR